MTPAPVTTLISRLAVTTVVLALGTMVLRAAWIGWAAWPPLLITALIGCVGIWLLRRAGVAFPVVLLAAIVVPGLLLMVLGRDQTESMVDSLTNSFPILLTSPFPAPVTGGLLAPGLVIAWAAGALSGFGLNRRTFVITPLVSGLILLIGADLLTAGGSDRFGLISFGLVAVVLAYWSSLAPRSKPGFPPGSGLAAVLGAFALIIGFVPLGRPFQPRELIQPPAISIAEPNPLPLLGHWARNPEEEILRRTGDDYPIHLVVLPDYNGVNFDSTSAYVRMGGTERPVLPPGRFQATMETAITWRTFSRWLPAPGVPVEVSVPGALIDVDTGSLLSPEVPTGGIVSYTVTGRVDAPRIAELAGADIGRHERYTALPDVPPEFVGYAREVTRGAESYLQQAQALERAVAGGRSFNPHAPGGSSYGRLHEFLFTPADQGGRVGTSEQFASAYAVLARSVGLPTRVVVGFGAGTPLAEAPHVNVVRGRDALAWPEVYFEGFGWVPFNPTPDVIAADFPTAGQPAPERPRSSPTPRPTPPVAPPAPPPGDDLMLWWLIPLGVLLAGGAGLGLGLARRTRSSRQAELGAIGAWLKVEDALVLAGRHDDRFRPASQRALELGIPEAPRVAEAAETAAFAPVTSGVGDDSWVDAIAVERALRAESVWWRRLLWPINPVVLRNSVGEPGQR